MRCSRTLWKRPHRFRAIRKFVLTFGTLPFGLLDFVHFPAAKFALDVRGSTLVISWNLWLAWDHSEVDLNPRVHEHLMALKTWNRDKWWPCFISPPVSVINEKLLGRDLESAYYISKAYELVYKIRVAEPPECFRISSLRGRPETLAILITK